MAIAWLSLAGAQNITNEAVATSVQTMRIVGRAVVPLYVQPLTTLVDSPVAIDPYQTEPPAPDDARRRRRRRRHLLQGYSDYTVGGSCYTTCSGGNAQPPPAPKIYSQKQHTAHLAVYESVKELWEYTKHLTDVTATIQTQTENATDQIDALNRSSALVQGHIDNVASFLEATSRNLTAGLKEAARNFRQRSEDQQALADLYATWLTDLDFKLTVEVIERQRMLQAARQQSLLDLETIGRALRVKEVRGLQTIGAQDATGRCNSQVWLPSAYIASGQVVLFHGMYEVVRSFDPGGVVPHYAIGAVVCNADYEIRLSDVIYETRGDVTDHLYLDQHYECWRFYAHNFTIDPVTQDPVASVAHYASRNAALVAAPTQLRRLFEFFTREYGTQWLTHMLRFGFDSDADGSPNAPESVVVANMPIGPVVRVAGRLFDVTVDVADAADTGRWLMYQPWTVHHLASTAFMFAPGPPRPIELDLTSLAGGALDVNVDFAQVDELYNPLALITSVAAQLQLEAPQLNAVTEWLLYSDFRLLGVCYGPRVDVLVLRQGASLYYELADAEIRAESWSLLPASAAIQAHLGGFPRLGWSVVPGATHAFFCDTTNATQPNASTSAGITDGILVPCPVPVVGGVLRIALPAEQVAVQLGDSSDVPVQLDINTAEWSGRHDWDINQELNQLITVTEFNESSFGDYINQTNAHHRLNADQLDADMATQRELYDRLSADWDAAEALTAAGLAEMDAFRQRTEDALAAAAKAIAARAAEVDAELLASVDGCPALDLLCGWRYLGRELSGHTFYRVAWQITAWWTMVLVLATLVTAAVRCRRARSCRHCGEASHNSHRRHRRHGHHDGSGTFTELMSLKAATAATTRGGSGGGDAGGRRQIIKDGHVYYRGPQTQQHVQNK